MAMRAAFCTRCICEIMVVILALGVAEDERQTLNRVPAKILSFSLEPIFARRVLVSAAACPQPLQIAPPKRAGSRQNYFRVMTPTSPNICSRSEDRLFLCLKI